MAPVYYQENGFPPEAHIDWQRLIPLIGPAHAAIARYDSALARIGERTSLLMPLTYKEVEQSSRIEGIETSVLEMMEFQARQESLDQRYDIKEVLNCIKAMSQAKEMLANMPLSLRIVREAHKTLLSEVRGNSRSPGEFRDNQNWIGPPGCTLENATYVPIGADRLPQALANWERYIYSDTRDLLVQAAVVHAEFEALHPFLDGNGRVGRMIVPWFLWEKGLIRSPVFNISSYLWKNRDEYYRKLLMISSTNDWTSWCELFLRALCAQANSGVDLCNKIVELDKEIKKDLHKVVKSRHAETAYMWISDKVVFRTSELAKETRIPEATAHRIIKRMSQKNYLRSMPSTKDRRQKYLVFDKFLRVVDDGSSQNITTVFSV